MQEGIEAFLSCAKDKVNGTLEIDFKDGVPQRARRTAHTVFGKDHTLTGKQEKP